MKKDLIRLGGIAAVLVVVLLVAAGFYTRSQTREQDAKVAQQVAASSQGGGAADDSAFVRPHSRFQGPKEAKVTIVEFLDPECESCRAMYPMVKHLLSEYGNRVRLVVRYMPFHQNSLKAIAALQAAGEQGRYWELLEALFIHQPRWGDHHAPRPELIPQLAEQVGLDMEAYRRSVATDVHQKIAELDRKDGESLGVTGTPTFFVNTRRLVNLGYEPLKAMIDEELAK
jgi:protein-disulfide isomerase